MQDADFVDALAGEDALSEEILIDVGDGACVDVEAGFTGVEGGETGACRRGDADAYAGLQDAVSLRHDAQLRVDDGLIQAGGPLCRSCARRCHAEAGCRSQA